MNTTARRPVILVIGPLSAIGGMATSMRLQLNSALNETYRLLPFDNCKRTPPGRSWWQGARSQLHLLGELWRLLADERPDLVHIHTCSGLTFYRSIIDLLAARLFGARVILHIRGGRFGDFLDALPAVRRALVRLALRQADRVVALSPSWADRLRRFDPRIRISIVRNGVVLPQHGKRRRESKTVRVVFVGALRAAKGVGDLLESVAALPRKMLAALEVRLIGPDQGGYTFDLRRRIEDLGLQGVVTICGAVPSQLIQAELRRADIFTLPSHVEGLPNALLEAMACGLPVVATAVGAVPEVLDHGIEGFLVPPRDPARLARWLRKLIVDPDLRRKMGRAARRRARCEFSQQRVVEALDDLYRRTLEPSGAT